MQIYKIDLKKYNCVVYKGTTWIEQFTHMSWVIVLCTERSMNWFVRFSLLWAVSVLANELNEQIGSIE